MFKEPKTWHRGDYSAIRSLTKVVVEYGRALAIMDGQGDDAIPVKAALLTGLRQLLEPKKEKNRGNT